MGYGRGSFPCSLVTGPRPGPAGMSCRSQPFPFTPSARASPALGITKHPRWTARPPPPHLWLLEAPVRNMILQMHPPPPPVSAGVGNPPHGLGVCVWMHLVNGTGNSPSPGRPTPGVVQHDKSSGGSFDTTKTRSDPQRVRMSGGERPIGAAKGTQSDTEASCHPPPPSCLRQKRGRGPRRRVHFGEDPTLMTDVSVAYDELNRYMPEQSMGSLEHSKGLLDHWAPTSEDDDEPQTPENPPKPGPLPGPTATAPAPAPAPAGPPSHGSHRDRPSTSAADASADGESEQDALPAAAVKGPRQQVTPPRRPLPISVFPTLSAEAGAQGVSASWDWERGGASVPHFLSLGATAAVPRRSSASHAPPGPGAGPRATQYTAMLSLRQQTLMERAAQRALEEESAALAPRPQSPVESAAQRRAAYARTVKAPKRKRSLVPPAELLAPPSGRQDWEDDESFRAWSTQPMPSMTTSFDSPRTVSPLPSPIRKASPKRALMRRMGAGSAIIRVASGRALLHEVCPPEGA